MKKNLSILILSIFILSSPFISISTSVFGAEIVDSDSQIPTPEYSNPLDEYILSDDESFDTNTNSTDENQEYHRSKVLETINELTKETELSGGNLSSQVQLVKVKILKGVYKDTILEAEYMLSQGFNSKYKYSLLEKNDEVFLFLEKNDSGDIEKAFVTEIARDKYLVYLIAVLVGLLLLVGRLKGLKSIISLGITIFAVFKILIPGILKGWNPILISVGICIVVICITTLIISGYNKKSFAAIIGTVGGVLIAGAVVLIIGSLAKLTGLGNEESQMLMFIPQNIQFNFRGLLFSGILIGTMGATMDVGMSIASAINEVKVNSPNISVSDLIKSGMNVGKDTMATMVNTLILAYTGGSLHFILLLMAYDSSFIQIVNWDMIASEILRASAGSIGIICTIPITAVVSGLIEKK